MKAYTLVILFVLCLGTALATDVSGTQSGTWTTANNPYQIVGDITVPVGTTLHIMGGVIVQAMGDYRITVQGTLLAMGNLADSISFESGMADPAALWGGIRLENEEMMSVIERCYIEKAENGVNSINSPVDINHNHFNLNQKAINVYGIGSAEPANVFINENLIENSIENAIFIAQNSNTSIQNNEIRYNGTGPQFRAAIQLSNQSAGGSNSPDIIGNHIHHNHKQGITAWDIVSSGAINPFISENVIEYNYTGIYLLQASGYIADNQINHNFIPGDMNSGAGVMVSGITTEPYFERNTITGNYAGFYVTNNARPVLGDLSIYHAWAQGENIIRDNIDANGNNNSIFCGAYPNSTTVIKAENNLWDGTDYASIAATIMDHEDNASLPTIDFDPWQEEVQETTIIGTIFGDTLESSVRVELVSEATGLVIGSQYLELTNQIDWVFTPPEPFYAVAYISNGWRTQFGAAGGFEEPTVFDPASGTLIDLGTIECLDQKPDSWIKIDNPVMLEGNLCYPVRHGFFVYHWHETQYLYQEGDFLNIYETQQIHNWADEPVSYIYPSEHRTWEKIFNVEAGDSWTKRLVDLSGDNPVFTNLEASVYEVGGIEPETRLMISYLLPDGREHSQKVFASGETLYYDRYLPSTGGCFMHMYDATELLPVTVEPDGSLFPLAAGNSYLLRNLEVYYNPTKLVYDVSALSAEPRMVKLYWQPILYSSSIFDTYKVYRNDVLVASLPADMDFVHYEEPFPTVPGSYSYYVTAAYTGEESEASNTVTIDVVSNQDQIQPPISLSIYPNPFLPHHQSLQIKSEGITEAKIKIFNLRGQLVRELPIDRAETTSWDLHDTNGRACAGGIYFLRLESEGTKPITQKLLILK